MRVQAFFDKNTGTISYVVSDPATQRCAIVDPVLDYDAQTDVTSTPSADQIIDYVKKSGLTVDWILETHIHADHLTAAGYLKEELGGKTGISERVTEVLEYWVPVFNAAQDIPLDGSQYDRLFNDGETFEIGALTVNVMHTPGHTPACVSYRIEDAVFIGDTLFMPDVGSARADFPGGDAETLYDSIQKILSLPDATRIFVCHDYPPQGRLAAWETTVGEQKKKNVSLNETIDKSQYVETRKKRDATLPPPRLLMPSIEANLQGGSNLDLLPDKIEERRAS